MKIDDTKNVGIEFICNEEYISINQSVQVKLIFFYEDILGNSYKREYLGGVFFSDCDGKRDDSLSIYFAPLEDPILTKIRYYYISEQDILKKEKEKKAIIESNEALRKKQSFNREEELDAIKLQFNASFYKSKLDKMIEYVKNNEKSDGGSGEDIRDINILSDNIVILKVEGEISFGQRKLVYSYYLKVELDKRTVIFNKFHIEDKNKISLIQLIKIKLLFMHKKLNF